MMQNGTWGSLVSLLLDADAVREDDHEVGEDNGEEQAHQGEQNLVSWAPLLMLNDKQHQPSAFLGHLHITKVTCTQCMMSLISNVF